MFRKVTMATGMLAIFAVLLFSQEGSKKKQKQPFPLESAKDKTASAEVKVAADVDELALWVQSYVAAFNQNDPAAVAGHWAENGVYVDRETGERTKGRERLLADFQQLFQDHAGAHLAVELTGSRLITPGVAAVEGFATAVLPGEEPSTTDFSAILLKQQGRWLLESVQESPPAAPLAAREALQELEWLVGHWVDESDSVAVDTTTRWGTAGTFLVRSFVVQPPDEEILQGTQVIGWDPRAAQIRSWNFFSDGSFGEAFWSRNGDEWLVKGNHTLADGRLASGTQVITRVDNDTQQVQLIGRDIDGSPLPSTEVVKVVRASSEEPNQTAVPPGGAGYVAPRKEQDAPAKVQAAPTTGKVEGDGR